MDNYFLIVELIDVSFLDFKFSLKIINIINKDIKDVVWKELDFLVEIV